MRKRRIKRVLKRAKSVLKPVGLALVLTPFVYVIVRVAPGDKLDTVNEYLALVGVFAAYLALSLLFNMVNDRWLSTRPVIVSTPEELEDGLHELSQILRDAGRSLKKIEMEISARELAAGRLAAKTEQLRSTAEMREDDAIRVGDFLTQMLNERMREMNRKSRQTSRIELVIGVLFSIPIGILINMFVR